MDEIIQALRRFRDERGWEEFHTPKDLAISVSIEAGELLEHFQWNREGHDTTHLDTAAVADEAADVMLYLLMFFDRLGLDPKVEALKKIERNEKRFPIEVSFGRPGSKIGPE